MAMVIKDITGNVVDKECGTGKVVSEPIKTRLTLNVPFSLVQTMKEIGTKYRYLDNNEYAMCFKVIKEGLDYTILEDEYLIPHQSVTGGHVRIETSLMSEVDLDYYHEFNGVTHRHPSNVRSFSRTDDVDLNKLFEVSLLYLQPYDLPTAVININVNGETLQLVPEIKVYGEINIASATMDSKGNIDIKSHYTTEPYVSSKIKLRNEVDSRFKVYEHSVISYFNIKDEPNKKVNKTTTLTGNFKFYYIDYFTLQIEENNLIFSIDEIISLSPINLVEDREGCITVSVDFPEYTIIGKLLRSDYDRFLEDSTK